MFFGLFIELAFERVFMGIKRIFCSYLVFALFGGVCLGGVLLFIYVLSVLFALL